MGVYPPRMIFGNKTLCLLTIEVVGCLLAVEFQRRRLGNISYEGEKLHELIWSR